MGCSYSHGEEAGVPVWSAVFSPGTGGGLDVSFPWKEEAPEPLGRGEGALRPQLRCDDLEDT